MDIEALKVEIDTDPLTRGYSTMSDQEVADDMNTAYRDGPANPSVILDYMMTTEFRNATIYGRVGIIADLQPDPTTGSFGNAQTGASAATVAIDIRMVSAAKALVRLTAPNGSAVATPLTNTQLTNILTEMDTTNAEVMSIAQRDAIIAFSQNQQTRGNELGLGFVKEGNVIEARL